MRSNGEGKPVIAWDVDGTLAGYHEYFLKFAATYLAKDMPSADRINPGWPLHRHMGISKATYREVKMAYRQGGMKRSMPRLHGARELINAASAPYGRKVVLEYRHVLAEGGSTRDEPVVVTGLGCETWICTTRPYLRLDNIDPDTREWLRRNQIKYDALLFDPVGGDAKYRELVRQAGWRVVAAVEDLPEQATRALRAGVPYVLLRDQPYNRHYEGDVDRVFRWGEQECSLLEAYNVLAATVRMWHQRHPLELY